MNAFTVPPSAPRDAPRDAPRAPFWSQFSTLMQGGAVVTVLTWYGASWFFGPRNGGVAAGSVLVLALLRLGLKWLKCVRDGWYEHKPIAWSLPHESAAGLRSVTFAADGIHFGQTLYKRTPDAYFVPYAQVAGVTTICRGVDLNSVKITFAGGASELIGNHDQTGEAVRSVLAILRQMAPHAPHSGPGWVGEGWVPRYGFGWVDNSTSSH